MDLIYREIPDSVKRDACDSTRIVRLPRCFAHTGNETGRSHLTELDTREAEEADVALGTSRDLATVVQTDGIGVAGDGLKLLCGFESSLRIVAVINDFLEGGTLSCILGYQLGALYLTRFH